MNSTNEVLYYFQNFTWQDECQVPQYFTNIQSYWTCYIFFVQNAPVSTALILTYIPLTLFFNALVFYLNFKRRNRNLTTFDVIIMGHSIVDFSVAILDGPFYYVCFIFGYWPMGQGKRYWSTFDNGVVIVDLFHMIYASYARLRAIQSPAAYSNDLFLRRPHYVMITIWIVAYLTYAPIVNGYGVIKYTTNINFSTVYGYTASIVLIWVIPLAVILAILIWIIKLMEALPRKKMIRGRRNIILLIGFYWIQWIPSCILDLVTPYYGGIPLSVTSPIYWLTYTVSLYDPIIYLALNRKRFRRSERESTVN